ncbi:hypothetical protein [Enterovibrio coralii]|nr:hypothetical protein [Enterovibrio coralii]
MQAIIDSLFTPIGSDGMIGILLILNGLKVTLMVTFFASSLVPFLAFVQR